jgi:hypothetical protein
MSIAFSEMNSAAAPIRDLILGLDWRIFFVAVLVSLVGANAILASRLLRRHATTLTISMLGFPRTGKTVYLTVLFDSLQRAVRPGVQFLPYGRETIEGVAGNLSTLASGHWLPKTAPGSVFFYRANAVLGSGLLRNRYKVEIGDYAGEAMAELNPADSGWLHKTDYFKYVVQSDAVILALDAQTLMTGSFARNQEIQNAFVAAVQVLAEEKGAIENRKLRVPVALLFMKSDILGIGDRGTLLGSVQRLIQVCEARCREFQIFFVSATGPLPDSGGPPQQLKSVDVVDPIVWILRRYRRSNSPAVLLPELLRASERKDR